MNCFGFGTTFSPAVLLDLTGLVRNNKASWPASGNATACQPPHATGHRPKSDDILAGDDDARQQAPDSTVHAQKPDRTGPGGNAATYHTSDGTAHGQNPDRTLTSGALPRAVGLELTNHVVTLYTKPTLTPAGSTPGQHPKGGAGKGGVKTAASSTAEGYPSSEELSQQSACNQGAQSNSAGKQGLAVARLQAKAAKDALKGLGWLDKSCRACTDPSSDVICLPLTDSGRTKLQSACLSSPQASSPQASSPQLGPAARLNHADAKPVSSGTSCTALSMANAQPLPTGELPMTAGSSDRLKGRTVGTKGKKQKAVGSQEADMACLLALMQAGLAVVQPMETLRSGRVEGGPAQRLKGAVAHLLQQQVSLAVLCCPEV